MTNIEQTELFTPEEIVEKKKKKYEAAERKAGVKEYIEETVIGNFTQKDIDTLKGTIAKGTTNEQFALFLQTSANAGLNPFLNHIYPIVYAGNMSLQVSVEGIMSLARKNEDYIGVEVQLIHENDAFKAGRTEGGVIAVKEHDIGFPRGKVIGCYAIARKANVPDLTVLMDAEEVEHHKKGRNSKMWLPYYNDMFRKHVLKRALKEQFGIEVSDDSERQTNNDTVFKQPTDVTPETVEEVIQVSETEIVKKEDVFFQLRSRIANESKDKGIDVWKFTEEKMNKKYNELNAQELTGLLKMIELTPKTEEIFAEFEEVEEVKDGNEDVGF